jgi:hypothetical protein
MPAPLYLSLEANWTQARINATEIRNFPLIMGFANWSLLLLKYVAA